MGLNEEQKPDWIDERKDYNEYVQLLDSDCAETT